MQGTTNLGMVENVCDTAWFSWVSYVELKHSRTFYHKMEIMSILHVYKPVKVSITLIIMYIVQIFNYETFSTLTVIYDLLISSLKIENSSLQQHGSAFPSNFQNSPERRK